MSIGIDSFPRPAFYHDLASIAKEGRTGAVLLLLDADCETIARTVEDWATCLNGVVIHAACMAESADAVAALATDAYAGTIRYVRLPQWSGGALSSDDVALLLALEPRPEVIVSCQAYDAHGEYVKKELEETILPFMKLTNALYLIHDPHYKVLRVADCRIVQDRLRKRPWRLEIYKTLVNALFRAGGLCARIMEVPSWRRVK